jgi:hypothetical protein
VPARRRAFDAVVFDLLTALIDSWTLWNRVAGSAERGFLWRRKYLELTYQAGAYRPYEQVVGEAAALSGIEPSCAGELIKCWDELAPWPETLVSRFRRSYPFAARAFYERRNQRDTSNSIILVWLWI